MDKVTPFEWARLFVGEQPLMYYLEIGLRVGVIFVGSFLILQLLGKRSRKQSNTFDMLVVIALGSAVGDVMFYPSVPILYAITVITVVVILNRILAWLDGISNAFHQWVDGAPTLMIENGQILNDQLKLEKMRESELLSLLRVNGISNLGQVKLCYLEPSGDLGLIKFEDGQEFDGRSTLPDESLLKR